MAFANNKNGEPEQFVVNSTTNICKFKQGFVGNFVIQTFLTDLQKFSNLKLECPIKKVLYTIYLKN